MMVSPPSGENMVVLSLSTTEEGWTDECLFSFCISVSLGLTLILGSDLSGFFNKSCELGFFPPS